MKKPDLKKAIFYTMLGLFWALATFPCPAQDLAGVPDPEVLVSPPASTNNPQHNTETSLVDIKAVDAPTLHTVNGKTGLGSEQRYGQGIILDSSGIIATNRHIIRNALHIYVALANGQIFEARLLRNSEADLCLIKINAPFALRAIALADPSELQIGNNIIAITNAAFNHQRKRSGQIIKIFKEIPSNNIELLEMNIPLKPGDSGGAVLNEEGSLLGLIMGKQISDPGKSYAIALNRIQQEYFIYRNSILN